MRRLVTLAAASLAWTAAAGASAPSTTILSCDFDTKPIDQVIGIGGPAANEPIDLSGTNATVRAAPLPTPSLEVSDTWGFGSRSVIFEFQDHAEIVSGVLTISMTLQFAQLENFSIRLREQGSSAVSILDVVFLDNGQIRYMDLDTAALTLIGSYAAGTAYAFQAVIDMDARTYDLSIGATLLRDDESLGASARGVGRLLVAMEHDVNSTGTFYADDVKVTATTLPTAVGPTSWGALKARWR